MISYTCNKKNIPVLQQDCQECSEYSPCAEEGKWCFAGALVPKHDQNLLESAMPAAQSNTAPVLRDTSTVTVHLGEGMQVNIYREDLKKQIEKELYKGSGLIFGA